MLVTFAHTKKNTLYLLCLPFGKGAPEKVVNVLYKCMKYCHQWNRHSRKKTMVRTVNECQLEFLKESPTFNSKFKFYKLAGIDRHHGVQNLVSLQGRQFANIRGEVNKFHRSYPNAVIRKYQPSDYHALLELKRYWNRTSGKKYKSIHDEVYYKEIIKHYEELEHLILVLEVDGQIVGMVSGGELPNGQSWACLLKTKKDIKGSSEVLMVEFAREINRINPNIELMNVGIDLGVNGGLRNFKEKFRPVLNLARYRLFLK